MSESDFQEQHSDEVEAELHADDVDREATADHAPGSLPDPEDVDQEEIDEIEEEREERLAPDNRPDGAEVDNTQRDFDTEVGMFTDHDDYGQADKRYSPDDEA
ncbi:hypothetical protein [Nocardioides coralli]|uniref:hypothetical protein n=1 Tax=Nocardioides coralli TaxID=2872154 RepID=UPI001CA44091|nr:hypothetical protein [Nocardioides coralli]QZY29941.1 hypothetical protein K6T13_04440 [Nocardioides coralli]